MDKSRDIGGFLRRNIKKIVDEWEVKIRKEIYSAKGEHTTILRDEIPAFLGYIADSLTGIKEPSNEKETLA